MTILTVFWDRRIFGVAGARVTVEAGVLRIISTVFAEARCGAYYLVFTIPASDNLGPSLVFAERGLKG